VLSPAGVVFLWAVGAEAAIGSSIDFLQQVLNGVSLGAIYGLIALGYTMVYGVLRFINFAHSEVFMTGAFAGWFFAQMMPGAAQVVGGPSSHPLWVGILVLVMAMAVGSCLGMLIEFLAYRPLRMRPRLICLITAIGVSLLLQNTGLLFLGAAPRPYPQLFPATTFDFFGLIISTNQIVVIATTLVLLVTLHLVVHHTKLGTAMRAVSQNSMAAALVGINPGTVITFTFGLGSALGAAGGVLYAINFPSIDPLMGMLPGLKGFVSAVLGGIGNIPGAALGGLILGIAETFVNGSDYSTFTDAIAFGILIVLLLFKPEGLLGKRRVEKV
jgi:branched-chain amino acid transport system permease protein